MSPADNFSWILKWYAELKIWASMKIPGDRGFCTLEDFLQSDGVAALWNNASLVASWTFVKDCVNGEEMSEDVAINLAALFPAELSTEPVTPQSGSKRRAFSKRLQRVSQEARRRATQPKPEGGVLALHSFLDSLAIQSRRKPCAAEKRSMTILLACAIQLIGPSCPSSESAGIAGGWCDSAWPGSIVPRLIMCYAALIRVISVAAISESRESFGIKSDMRHGHGLLASSTELILSRNCCVTNESQIITSKESRKYMYRYVYKMESQCRNAQHIHMHIPELS